MRLILSPREIICYVTFLIFHSLQIFFFCSLSRFPSHFSRSKIMQLIKIAIEGCCHGELNKIYQRLSDIPDISLLLICGDFQSIRNESDLQSISVPEKYKRMADFHEYYKGERKAPILTIFIGGNHECSSYLQELKYGGWVAPNIYYLGEFGSLWYNGIQITGWSGIFNYHSFVNQNIQMEKIPYDQGSLRSVYHTKLQNFLKMYMMNHDMDIIMSHDWPVGIERYGNQSKLIKMKPFFKEDIKRGELGSPLNKFLIHYLRPRNWYSGHLHVKFEAIIKKDLGKINDNELELNMDDDEEEEEEEMVKNKQEISLDMDDDDSGMDSNIQVGFEETFHFVQSGGSNKKLKTELTPKRGLCEHDTKFLALDKCGNKRNFLEVQTVEITHPTHPSAGNSRLYFSKRAIAINRVVESYLQQHQEEFYRIDTKEILRNPHNFPLVNELMRLVDLEAKKLSTSMNDEEFIVPENFEIIAPVKCKDELKYYPNNQTQEYCEKFNIPKPNCLL